MGFLTKMFKGVGVVLSLVMGIEPMFAASKGDDKKSMVLGLLTSIIGISESVAGKDIMDEKAFNDGISQMIDGAVKCLNASIWYKKG